MDVSIIIVNYNTYELTVQCIESIRRFVNSDVSYEIIVVDNDSRPEIKKSLRTIAGIELILSESNLGFGAGNNLGVSKAAGKYILLLNSDTVFVEDSLSVFIAEYKRLKAVGNPGVLGGQLVSSDLEPAASYFGFLRFKKTLFDGYRLLVNRMLRQPYSTSEQTVWIDGTKQVDYVIGADMFLETVLYRDYNGFDEDFFMYFEEADLQLRMVNDGYDHFVTDKTKIIHLEGGSQKEEAERVDKVPNNRRIRIHESRNLYLKKHLSKHQYFLYKISELLLTPLRLVSPNHPLKENAQFIKSCLRSL